MCTLSFRLLCLTCEFRNDPDQPTAATFSDLAASPQAQTAFAESLIKLMTTFGFDGVDIDW